ncbi:MAG: pantoate--beta-alanine ligase [Bacilli bacterium]
MKIITTIKEMQQWSKQKRSEGNSIGFVPTMGFLHEGHVALMTASKQECDLTVTSIFVNPLQFGPNEDLDRYPRNIVGDEATCSAAGVDVLFYPAVQEMYPTERNTTLLATQRSDVLCGASRPGHFDGVITVVSKLFNIVLPDVAFFGRKDAQQVAVIEGLVSDYNFPVEIRAVGTVREEDGLAKSSRNVYLTEDERKDAVGLNKTLAFGKHLVQSGVAGDEAERRSIAYYNENFQGEIDYLNVLSFPALTQLNKSDAQCIIAIAVKYSKARLIDNIIFTR